MKAELKKAIETAGGAENFAGAMIRKTTPILMKKYNITKKKAVAVAKEIVMAQMAEIAGI